MKSACYALILSLLPLPLLAAGIVGTVTDNTTGKPMPFTNVVLEGGASARSALSGADGAYAIDGVDPGTYVLTVSFIGYTAYRDTIAIDEGASVRIDVALESAPILGETILVEGDRFEAERSVQPGFIGFETGELQSIPSVGERDVIRSLQLLPGIQAASDISSGLYIRGGGPDQNLILLDDIPLYNPSHAFGIFSTFNPDAIDGLTLHKGAYPAEYGGRLGSVLAVEKRDGNRKGLNGRGGVSVISARTTLDGPIPEGSWMVSGRRTYLEPILSAIRNDSTDVPDYFFYDLNAKLVRDIGGSNRFSVSGYFGRDDLNFDLEEGTYVRVRWGNAAAKANWRHLFSPRLIGNLTASASHYTSRTSVSFFETPVSFTNSIQDLSARGHVDFFASDRHAIKVGFAATRYTFAYRQRFNQDDQVDLQESPSLLAFYISDLWQPRSGTQARLGVRSHTFTRGGRFNLEPRLSISQDLSEDLSVKLAGGVFHQYLQLVATEGFSGGDFWVPLDETVSPGRSLQGMVGIDWEPGSRYAVSLEGYYTDMADLVVLDNRIAVDNESSSSEDLFVSGGSGRATGAELLVRRKVGSLTGWIGYTLGWTQRRFSELNADGWFPAKYDRRHDLSAVAGYAYGRWTFGASFVYGTGQAFTPASARYTLRSTATGEFLRDDFVLPAKRNSGRLLPYHRLDLSARRAFRLFGTDMEAYLQVFNVYNRRNEWFVQYDTDNPQTEPKVVKMLPILPTLGVDFAF